LGNKRTKLKIANVTGMILKGGYGTPGSPGMWDVTPMVMHKQEMGRFDEQ